MSQNYVLNLEFLGTGTEALSANIKAINASLVQLKTTADSLGASLSKSLSGAGVASAGKGMAGIAAGMDLTAAKSGMLNKVIQQQSGFLNAVYANGNKVMQSRYFGNGISGLAQAHQRLNAELQNTIQMKDGVASFWNAQANGTDKFRLRADMLSRTLDSTLQKWTAMGKNMQWTGRQGMVGVTLPVIGVAGLAIDQTLKYADQFRRLQELTGTLVESGGSLDLSKNTKQVQDLINLDTKLSQTYGVQRNDLIGLSAEYAGLGGVMGANAGNLTKWAAQFNLIANMNDIQASKTFIEQLANANVALGNSVGQTGNDLAYINKVEQTNQINMNQMVSAFPTLTSLMETFHMNLGEVIGVLTTFKQEGLSIDQGATKFATSMGRVTAAVTSAGSTAGRLKNVLKEIQNYEAKYNVHLSVFDQNGKLMPMTNILQSMAQLLNVPKGGPQSADSINLATALFGTRSYAAMDPVLQGILQSYSAAPNAQGLRPGFAGATQLYQQSNKGSDLTDYYNKTIQIAQQNAATQWKDLVQKLKNMAIAIGTDILPIFESFVSDIEKVINWFEKLSPGTRHLIEKMLLLAAAIPPIVYMFGQFNILGSLIAKGLTKPFTTFFKLSSKPIEEATAPGVRTQLAHLTAMQRMGAAPEDLAAQREQILRQVNAGSLGGLKPEEAAQVSNLQMQSVAEKQSLAADKQLLAAQKQEDIATGKTIKGGANQGSLFDQPYYKKNLAAQGHEDLANTYNNKIKNARRDFESMTPGASYSEAEYQSYLGDLKSQRDKHLSVAKSLRRENPVQGTLFGEATRGIPVMKGATLATSEIQKSGGTLKKLLTADTSVWFGQGLSKGAEGAKGVLSKITESSIGKKVGQSTLGKMASPMKMLFPAMGEEGGATLLTSFAPLLPVLLLVGGAIFLIVKNWKSFAKEVKGPLNDLKAAFKDLINVVITPFKKVFDEIGLSAKSGSTAASGMGTAIAGAFKIARAAIKVAIDLISPWVHILADIFGAVISAVQLIIDILTGKWGAAWQAAKNLVGFVVQGILTYLMKIPEQLMGLASTFTGFLSHIPGLGFLKGWSRDLNNWKNDSQKLIDNLGKDIRGKGADTSTHILDPKKAHDSGKQAGKAAAQGVTEGLSDISGAPSGNDASAFASAFESQMQKIVDQWKKNALAAYDLMVKKRDQMFDNQTKQLDLQQKQQDKVYDNEKKHIDDITKAQDQQNKMMEHQNNEAADIAQGKFSDAKSEQLKAMLDMNQNATQSATDALDAQKQAYDDQISAQKDTLTQQKQLFDDQASAQKQMLQDQLDNITTYMPMTQAAMQTMQNQILAVVNNAAGQMHLGAFNQGIQFNSGWQDAINNTENDLIKQAEKSGAAVAAEFASAIASTNAKIAAITGGSVGDPGNSNPASPSTDTSGGGTGGSAGAGTPSSPAPPMSIGTSSPGGNPANLTSSPSYSPIGATSINAQGGVGSVSYGPYPITGSGSRPTGVQSRYHTGGSIGGNGDIPAILQSGEYVIQRPAANALGIDALSKLNMAHKFHSGGMADYLGSGWTGIMNQVISGWIKGTPKSIGGISASALSSSTIGSFTGGPMGSIPTAPVNISSIVALGKQMAGAYGWGSGQEWNALYSIFNRESGWNPYAVNKSSGAAGIPQALGHGNVFALGDAAGQIRWGLDYLKGRYGDPINGWNHELKYGWYHGGGNVAPLKGFGLGGMVLSDGPALVHAGESVLSKPITQQLNNSLANITSDNGKIEVNVNFAGHNFGTEAELRNMARLFEDRIVPRLQRAAGNTGRVQGSF